MTDPLEIGRWYAFEGTEMSLCGRPVQVVRTGGGAVHGRWASGMERLLLRSHIGEQVEDAMPGITEPCLICGGTESVPVIEVAEEDALCWDRNNGRKPCPNCRRLD